MGTAQGEKGFDRIKPMVLMAQRIISSAKSCIKGVGKEKREL